MSFLRSLWSRLAGFFFRHPKPYGVELVEGDELPQSLVPKKLFVAREHGVDWEAGMICPCGCGDRLAVVLLKGVKPRWDVHISSKGHPSLHPSIWRSSGCRSHFWLRDGRIIWCSEGDG